MSHKDILRQLFPLELGGIFDQDVAVEARPLDTAEASAATLLNEMMPTVANQTLADWERVTGLIPASGEPFQSRRDKVVQKLRTLGDIKKPYFEQLAAALGYSLVIQEYIPTMAGWVGAGDELMVQDDERILFIWNCHINNQSIYRFRAGQAAAGERLTWWAPQSTLEALLDDLRPAHVELIFSYA